MLTAEILPDMRIMMADAGAIILLPIILATIAFWIWMLVDCANHEAEGGTKVAWLLIILFLGAIGAPLYFFVRKLPRERRGQFQRPAGLLQPWRRV